MFIFAIIYFGILQDIGLFNPVVTDLIKATRDNVVLAAIGTVVHFDGAGDITFLLTIPALLALYQVMHMSRYVLLSIMALVLGLKERHQIARLRRSSEFVGQGEVGVDALAVQLVEHQRAERARQGYRYREARWSRVATDAISVAPLTG
ncbi:MULTISPECIES: SLC13 family permease [unclassified Corynebacterium]|uniref:SLC13 family permease n=1 Tax=unclassified Corynebacterium TaxID=2624378 RepID=UPI001D0F2644|nr:MULTISPECIES: SLC13 family permease [unclassified Corynebacterium]